MLIEFAKPGDTTEPLMIDTAHLKALQSAPRLRLENGGAHMTGLTKGDWNTKSAGGRVPCG